MARFIWTQDCGHSMVVDPGDRVTIITPHDTKISGRVVFSFETHVVLNAGGRHGTPKVGDNRNIVSVRRRRI